MLSLASPAGAMMAPRPTTQAIIRGTIRGQITYSTDPQRPSVLDTDFSGQGTARNFGRITYRGHDEYPTITHIPFAGNGMATLTTSDGATLAVRYDGPGRSLSPRVEAYKLSGTVLGSLSTGQFARSSGTFSGQNNVNYVTRTFQLTFTVKPG